MLVTAKPTAVGSAVAVVFATLLAYPDFLLLNLLLYVRKLPWLTDTLQARIVRIHSVRDGPLAAYQRLETGSSGSLTLMSTSISEHDTYDPGDSY